MDLLLNDQSLHGQFPDIPAFRESIGRIMEMRVLARKFGRELYAHRNVTNNRINAALSLYEALQKLSRDEKQSLSSWLTKRGPFWEDAAEHGPDDWLQCGDEIVTDTAVGEAAYCTMVGIDRDLVSFTPSDWEYSPVPVQLISNSSTTNISVQNYWRLAELETALQAAEPSIASWQQLESVARMRFQRLTFSNECFRYLDGHPFVHGAADKMLMLFDVLNKLMAETDARGQRTPEGIRLHNEYFTGAKAWFSDAAPVAKVKFRNEHTFPHPEQPNQTLFCTWHGKVNQPPFRVHFSWPLPPGFSLYVVYVGWKITV